MWRSPKPDAGPAANTSDAFVPPNPNEFDRTALGSSGSRWGLPATKLASRWGCGLSRFRVCGAIPCTIASKQKMASTAPAAPSKCPVAPLVEDTAMAGSALPPPLFLVAAAPNTDAIACCSASSPAVLRYGAAWTIDQDKEARVVVAGQNAASHAQSPAYHCVYCSMAHSDRFPRYD